MADSQPSLCCCAIKIGSLIVFYIELLVVTFSSGSAIYFSATALANLTDENVTNVDELHVDISAYTIQIVIQSTILLAIVVAVPMAHIGVCKQVPNMLILLLVTNVLVVIYYGIDLVLSLILMLMGPIVFGLIRLFIYMSFTHATAKCFKWLKSTKFRTLDAVQYSVNPMPRGAEYFQPQLVAPGAQDLPPPYEAVTEKEQAKQFIHN